MKKTAMILSAVAVCVAVFSAGCKPENNNEEYNELPYFYSMDTEAQMSIPRAVAEVKKAECNELYRKTRLLLAELEMSLSATHEGTPVSNFNEAPAGATVEIDKVSYEVLLLAKDVYQKTEGYYNPSVYYSVYEYGFFGQQLAAKAPSLPSADRIAKFNQLSAHFGEIELKEEDEKYYAVKPDAVTEVDGVTYSMKIDLGGIGKGYAVDKVDALMKEEGFNRGFFSFGSSSIACKQYDDKGKGYTLGFTNPRPQDNAVYVQTTVKDACLSTSGDYERYYEIDGVRYCHVIDPTTGHPVRTGIMTASVIGGIAAEDDSLTTAIMAMGRDRAIEFINENLSDRKVIFVYDDGGKFLIYTNMPEDTYKITDESFTVANKVVDGKIVIGD